MKINRLYVFLIFLFFSYLFCPLITNHYPLTTAFASDWQEYQRNGDKNSKWDSFVEAGFNAFEGSNLGSAEMFLQRAIARGCNDGLVYTKIAIYYEAQSNYKKAAEFFKKASKLLSNQYPSHILTKSIDEFLGRVLFLKGDIREAAPYLNRAVERNASFTALYLFAQLSRTDKDYNVAIKYFEKALLADHPKGLSPNIDILIMIEIGKSYFELKKFDISLEWWNRILAFDPANPTAETYKADIEKQRYKEEERKVLEQIVN
jgi:tetratricopeptide (TPR) repeat protein